MEGLKKLLDYKTDCALQKAQLGDCEALGARMMSVTPWYASKWFFLFTGLAVGFTGAVIYTYSK